MPDKGTTAGTGNSGGIEGGQAEAGKTAGTEVERLFNREPPIPCESRRRMRGWYRAAVDHDLPLAQIKLYQITEERMEIYCNKTPPPPPQGRILPRP